MHRQHHLQHSQCRATTWRLYVLQGEWQQPLLSERMTGQVIAAHFLHEQRLLLVCATVDRVPRQILKVVTASSPLIYASRKDLAFASNCLTQCWALKSAVPCLLWRYGCSVQGCLKCNVNCKHNHVCVALQLRPCHCCCYCCNCRTSPTPVLPVAGTTKTTGTPAPTGKCRPEAPATRASCAAHS